MKYSIVLILLLGFLQGCNSDKKVKDNSMVVGNYHYTTPEEVGIPERQTLYFNGGGGDWEFKSKYRMWALPFVDDGDYCNLDEEARFSTNVTCYHKTRHFLFKEIQEVYYESPTSTLHIMGEKINLHVEPLKKNEKSRQIIFELRTAPWGPGYYIEVIQQRSVIDLPKKRFRENRKVSDG